METIQGNKLIAEFMGAKLLLGMEYEMYGLVECIEDGPDEKHFYLPEEMKFHSSWDWIMPVGEKCVKIAEEMEADEWLGSIFLVTSNFHLPSLFKELVEFIQWYNENK